MESPKAKIIIGDSRELVEIENESIDLAVTSPPYWNIKDYGVRDQIGFNQTLHRYLIDLYRVWKEAYRVLKPGSRLCINIGDQFLRSSLYGRYKIVPIHAEFVSQCEQIGFDYMGSIIWQKKTTMNTTGGANVMGSFPYPKNGILEIDFEFILIFKKPGRSINDPEAKEKSRMSKEDWKQYFSAHWSFSGERQTDHEAMFPEELPTRLIKMFSFVGDTVLDPFLGSGTTIKAAMKNKRNSIGYEINREFLPTIVEKIKAEGTFNDVEENFEIVERPNDKVGVGDVGISYNPTIKDFSPATNSKSSKGKDLHRVSEVLDAATIKIDDGLTVRLRGIEIINGEGALAYLVRYVKGKQVYLRAVKYEEDEMMALANVYLKNGIFINKELLKQRLADQCSDDSLAI